MDRELRAFLNAVPQHGVVVDVGGGWGWHWRGLAERRSDVAVVIVDFVRDNLEVGARMLGALVEGQVFLVHADATKLPFPSDVFDGYWSVQALQHIPGFEQAVAEGHRVLRPGGAFVCYSLNRPHVLEAVASVMGRPYDVDGRRPGRFYLARASAEQAAIVSRIFGARVVSRYTEVLFHPELRLNTGGVNSRIGALDAYCSSSLPCLAWIARQRSYHTKKRA